MKADLGSGRRAFASEKPYSFSALQLSLCTYAQIQRVLCGWVLDKLEQVTAARGFAGCSRRFLLEQPLSSGAHVKKVTSARQRARKPRCADLCRQPSLLCTALSTVVNKCFS